MITRAIRVATAAAVAVALFAVANYPLEALAVVILGNTILEYTK